MPNLNKVFLVGHTTDIPEAQIIQTGTLCRFTLAVNSGYGEKQETCFAECTCFGKTAENIQKYAGKGSCLLIEGRLRTDSWVDKETGRKRSKTSIIAERVQIMDKKQTGYIPDERSVPQYSYANERREQQRDSRNYVIPPVQDDDDIPF